MTSSRDSGDNDSMKGIDPQTVIAVCALVSVLYGLIHLAVAPLKSDMKRLEAKVDRLLAQKTGASGQSG